MGIRSGPSDDRRDRATDRADDRTPCGAALQRRVEQHVDHDGARREHGAQRIHGEREPRGPGNAERERDPECRALFQAPGDDGTIRGARHEGIHLHLPELVERRGACRTQRGAEHRLDEPQPLDVLRAHPVADECGDEHEEVQPCLREIEQICEDAGLGACVRDFGGGDGVAQSSVLSAQCSVVSRSTEH